jgi:hypothetical protein
MMLTGETLKYFEKKPVKIQFFATNPTWTGLG